MSVPSVPTLVDQLTQSLESARELVPSLQDGALGSTPDGISLLDTKNDLLLSYLQHLSLLMLTRIRQLRQKTSSLDDDEDTDATTESLVKKLAEVRLYLEKGVRPLEDKLRYQIDKVLRAADQADRRKAIEDRKKKATTGESEHGSSSEDSDDGGSDSEASDSDSEEVEVEATSGALAPRLSAFTTTTSKPAKTGSTRLTKGISSSGKDDGEEEEDASRPYRPSKTRRVVMGGTYDEGADRGRAGGRRPNRSRTMEEYIEEEFSTAPVVEPSIGTTIVEGGRHTKTAADRRKDDERREYEESNFIRLPKESKKDRARQARADGRSGRMQFGGEEWRDLGEGIDRISRLTKRRNAASGTQALLKKSRKRTHEDGGDRRGGNRSYGMGDRFQKRLRTLD